MFHYPVLYTAKYFSSKNALMSIWRDYLVSLLKFNVFLLQNFLKDIQFGIWLKIYYLTPYTLIQPDDDFL